MGYNLIHVSYVDLIRNIYITSVSYPPIINKKGEHGEKHLFENKKSQ